MRSIQLITDCEGPLSLNDNAFELCRDFLKPDGARFFTQVSRYDDYLVDIEKKPGYKAGDTLKLIVPFFKANGLTNACLEDYSRRTLKLVPGVVSAYEFLRHRVEKFIVSTSYDPHPRAVGGKLAISPGSIFATKLDLDSLSLGEGEADELMRYLRIIVEAPAIELSGSCRSLRDLPEPVQESIHLMDEIFWKTIPAMQIGETAYREVNPVGGIAKAQALWLAVAKTGIDLKDAVYVGDSITDMQAFQVVRSAGGLAVAFNANAYGLREAEIAIAGDNAWPTALVAAIFTKWGREGVLEMIKLNSRPRDLRHLMLPVQWQKELAVSLMRCKFSMFIIEKNPEEAENGSKYWRKKLRQDVAHLG